MKRRFSVLCLLFAALFPSSLSAGVLEDGRRLTYASEVAPPHRLVRQTGANGEELALTGSTRMAYWKLNAPGGEKHLEEIGLGDD